MRRVVSLQLFLALFVGGAQGIVFEKSDEQRLIEDLLYNYDPKVRPVLNSSKAVVVKLGITLTMIIDVDERNQVLNTNIWLDQEWFDERLVWNATDYGNLKSVRIPCDRLWLPDIVLYNSVDDYSRGYHKALAWVYPDGRVFWPPIVQLRSSCKLDITFFPFDDQLCRMKFGSWAYDGYQVDVQKYKPNIDTENMMDNGEWTMMGTHVQRNVKTYPCCPEPYPDITFYLHMRRRVLYYCLNVIIPCLLFSSLTLISFALPPDSGEKVTLGLTVLLAFSVFMLLVAETMPPTSEFAPLIGIYLTVVMALTSLSVVFAVIVLNLNHRGHSDKRPPRWFMRFVTRYLVRFCCIRRTGPSKSPLAKSLEQLEAVVIDPQAETSDTESAASANGPDAGPAEWTFAKARGGAPLADCPEVEQISNHVPVAPRARAPLKSDEIIHRLQNGVEKAPTAVPDAEEPLLEDSGWTPKRPSRQRRGAISDTRSHRAIVENLAMLVRQQRRQEMCMLIYKEWYVVSMAVDRILAIIFVVVTVVSTMWLLVFQPMTKHYDLDELRNNSGR